MRFLVDSDICSYAMRLHPQVLQHFESHRRQEIGVSALCEAELRYGVSRTRSKIAQRAVDRFLSPFEIVEFGTAHASVYGELRSRLERAGTPIGTIDTLLAAQALALDLVLVTNNVREFRRVPKLKLENWTA